MSWLLVAAALAAAALTYRDWSTAREAARRQRAEEQAERDLERRRALPIEVVNREAAKVGAVVSKLVHATGSQLRPGDRDTAVVERLCAELPDRIQPAMLHYNGFPAAAAVSVNEEVLHGSPSGRTFESGDLVTLQFAGGTDKAFGSMGWTFAVGEVSPVARDLLTAGRSALNAAVAVVRPGARIGDIGAAIQGEVEAAGFAVVRDYVGCGIGADLVQGPQVPAYGREGTGKRLKPGLLLHLHVFAKQGGHGVTLAADDWTVHGEPGELSVLFTAMVLVTSDGAEVLTHIPD